MDNESEIEQLRKQIEIANSEIQALRIEVNLLRSQVAYLQYSPPRFPVWFEVPWTYRPSWHTTGSGGTNGVAQ